MDGFVIPSSLWSDPEFISLSPEAKTVYFYLLAGPNTNCLGCFRCPAGYIATDLKLAAPIQVESALNDLKRAGFISYDQPSEWVLLTDFLVFNPLRPQHLDGVAPLLARAPEVLRMTLSSQVQPLLDQYLAPKPATEAPPVAGPSLAVPEVIVPTPETSAPAPDAADKPLTSKERKQARSLKAKNTEIEQEICNYWNAMAKGTKIPLVRWFNEERSKKLAKRLEDPVFCEHWREAIDKIGASSWCKGTKPNSDFVANLDWYLKPEMFVKILEGNYRDSEPVSNDPAVRQRDVTEEAIRLAEEREAREAKAALPESMYPEIAYPPPEPFVDDFPPVEMVGPDVEPSLVGGGLYATSTTTQKELDALHG